MNTRYIHKVSKKQRNKESLDQVEICRCDKIHFAKLVH
jgi:hypothetical protein